MENHYINLLMIELAGDIRVASAPEDMNVREGDEVDVKLHSGQLRRGKVLRKCYCAKDDDIVVWIEILTEMICGVEAVWRKIEFRGDSSE